MFEEIGDSQQQQQQGPRLYPNHLVGHLLLVWPVEYIANAPGGMTKANGLNDAINVDLVVLDVANEANTEWGLLTRGQWWRPNVLIATLKPKVGAKQPILARMGRGEAARGQQAPYILVSATGDPDAVARGQAWLAAHPDFVPSQPRAIATSTASAPGGFAEPQPFGSSFPTPQPLSQAGFSAAGPSGSPLYPNGGAVPGASLPEPVRPQATQQTLPDPSAQGTAERQQTVMEKLGTQHERNAILDSLRQGLPQNTLPPLAPPQETEPPF